MVDGTPATPTKTDELIDKIFDHLPARTVEEIADGIGVTIGYATVLITILRKNPLYYEWTIPHVKRGINNTDEYRFHAVLIAKDGKWELDEDAHVHARQGAISTVSTIATQQENESAALMALREHTRSINLRKEYEEVSDDLGYVTRKLKRLEERLRNGTED
jgi:hypothetical protein